MLLTLFDSLSQYFGPFRVFEFLTIRAIAATLTALLFSLMLGPRFINKMRDTQVAQVIREEGPEALLGVAFGLVHPDDGAPRLSEREAQNSPQRRQAGELRNRKSERETHLGRLRHCESARRGRG